jgi:hypothetical protein
LIFITLGGGYYSNYRKCIADAQVISLLYNANKYEILYRRNRVVDAIKRATTMADIRKALDEKIYFDMDLKDKTMPELVSSHSLPRAAWEMGRAYNRRHSVATY